MNCEHSRCAWQPRLAPAGAVRAKHTFDPERNLRRGFSHDNFTFRSRVPWQLDEPRFAQLVHGLMRHLSARGAREIISDTGAQAKTRAPTGPGMEHVRIANKVAFFDRVKIGRLWHTDDLDTPLQLLHGNICNHCVSVRERVTMA
jgi:hypothetical protein